jgi:cytochrome c biogenesis factor
VDKKPTPASIVIIVAGALMLIGSFLNFYEISFFGETDGRNAWSGDLFFPVTIIPVLCGVVMALHVVLTTFANVDLPERVLGFSWNQLHLVLGVQAVLMMLAFLLQDKGGLDIAIGFWLMLLSAIGLAVGAVLREREPSAA